MSVGFFTFGLSYLRLITKYALFTNLKLLKMKKLKIFISIFIIALAFASCTNDENTVGSGPEIEESASMQNVVARLQSFVTEDGTLITSQNPSGNIIFDFCFDFVYPINLIYNNGTVVTVNSFQELIQVIINSTNELYIVGIEYPFQVEVYNPVTNEIEIVTINNETEFIALLESCDFNDCDCPLDEDPVCVEVQTGGGTEIITFINACFAECEGFTPNDFVPCPNDCDCPTDYDPVCVETASGDIIEFDNECLALCEGYTPNDFVDCENDCNCTNEYVPVCVESGGQIIEFQNACFAFCEGFTQADFVDCPVEECEISNLQVIVGECNTNGTYSITIDFDHVNAENDFFDVYVRNNEFIGFFALADLPITIEEFELSGLNEDYVKVCINDNSDCCQETEWTAPDCTIIGDCNCSGDYDPVCVELTGGTVITYFNACYAECDGFTQADWVSCPGECSNCINAGYDPICVEVNGLILTMYNECFLFCNGFTPNNIVDCN